MHLECVVSLFFINYLILNYLILNYLFPFETYIRPFLTSLLTAIFIILSTWLIIIIYYFITGVDPLILALTCITKSTRYIIDLRILSNIHENLPFYL